MTDTREHNHWLSKYATNHHDWKQTTSSSGTRCFKRPLGLVETFFDIDGLHYGGRADMNTLLTLKIRHSLSKKALRKRVALAWTSLQLQHTHLMSRAEDDKENGERCFFVHVPESPSSLVQDTEKSIVWIEDFYQDVTRVELFHHGMNVKRIIEPDKCLSKIFVLPMKSLPDGTLELPFLIILAHQISDGLCAYNWYNHFIQILNTPLPEIEADINRHCTATSIWERLPPAQEALYPPIAGNIARQRWFWAIIRVLRHVKKTLPPTFVNPLRRNERLAGNLVLEPKFDKLFDYSKEHQPPMSCLSVTAALSASASQRLIHLCRAVNVSIGAGCFALAGLAMMELYESRYPHISDAERPAFVAGFPLNPRTFFTKPPPAESCMLAFSDGIVMPFLSCSLPIEGRFKLTAKHANRHLRMYQKRIRGNDKKSGVSVGFDEHSPARLMATGYITQIERVQANAPPEKKPNLNPQGSLVPRTGKYRPTCGVSSIGSIATFFKPGTYDLDDISANGIAVDFVDIRTAVRARENEFLIGSWTEASGIVGLISSFDWNAISPKAVEMWKHKIEGLLETRVESRL